MPSSFVDKKLLGVTYVDHQEVQTGDESFATVSASLGLPPGGLSQSVALFGRVLLPLPRSDVLFSCREAESFKEQGNAFYAKKDYHEAYNYYTKAIGEEKRKGKERLVASSLLFLGLMT